LGSNYDGGNSSNGSSSGSGGDNDSGSNWGSGNGSDRSSSGYGNWGSGSGDYDSGSNGGGGVDCDLGEIAVSYQNIVAGPALIMFPFNSEGKPVAEGRDVWKWY
jgi:hypothetical protein